MSRTNPSNFDPDIARNITPRQAPNTSQIVSKWPVIPKPVQNGPWPNSRAQMFTDLGISRGEAVSECAA
jgi:hypothetical protein